MYGILFPNFVMNNGQSFEILGICLLIYHVDGESAFTSFICEIAS